MRTTQNTHGGLAPEDRSDRVPSAGVTLSAAGAPEHGAPPASLHERPNSHIPASQIADKLGALFPREQIPTIEGIRDLRLLYPGQRSTVYIGEEIVDSGNDSDQRALNRKVVIKVLCAPQPGGGWATRLTELRNLAEIRAQMVLGAQGYVPPLLYHGELVQDALRFPYIVMPFSPRYSLGEELNAFISFRPGSSTVVGNHRSTVQFVGSKIHELIDICRSIEAVRYEGMIHQDLKPTNMLGRQLCDLGLVETVDVGSVRDIWLKSILSEINSITKARPYMVGTLDYMAPEQLSHTDLSHQIDIFAFGATMYHLLSTRAPFPRTSAVSTVNVRERYEGTERELPILSVLKELHPKLYPSRVAWIQVGERQINELRLFRMFESIINRCMAHNRADRYTSIGEVRVDLEAIRDGRPIPHFVDSWLHRTLDKMRIWKTTIVGACALTAGLAAGGTIGWLYGREQWSVKGPDKTPALPIRNRR